MRTFFSTFLLMVLFCPTRIQGQTQHFTIKLAPFSSNINDEFSPVYYKDGIVFCSNQHDNKLISYNNGKKRLIKLFYVQKKGNTEWSYPRILAGELNTDANDGPATFNSSGDIIYYSRNNFINYSLRNISDSTNKLGIYSAELIHGKYSNIIPFKYNNPLYLFCSPALSSDGEQLYFSSDMPGGYGGLDLYYCKKNNNEWDPPVNLGPLVNTPYNESYPFICKNGRLFFASDRHDGFGGLDIYYTQEINGKWTLPVHLDSTINSPADDFGLVMDSTCENGYFSSNRRTTDDIFSFSLTPLKFTNCDSMKENNNCFTFYDERYQHIDSIHVTYLWNFGDGIIHEGFEVKHCFPGPGTYSVKLRIMDEITGKPMIDEVEYNVELKQTEQAYIHSMNVGIADQPMSFDGLQSYFHGYTITNYLWNFGDGFKSGKEVMNHTFNKPGEFNIQMALLAKADSLGEEFNTCVTKKITIANKFSELILAEKQTSDFTTQVGTANNMQIVRSRIFVSDHLSERCKQVIHDSTRVYHAMEVGFDRYEINRKSFPFLNSIARILTSNPGIKLEIVVHAHNSVISNQVINTSERWAQELTFYLKNKDVSMEALHTDGIDFQTDFLIFGSGQKTVDETIEFIFVPTG